MALSRSGWSKSPMGGAFRVFLAPTAISIALAAAFALASDQRGPHERAQEWVVAHAADLPTDLDELAAFPDPYRVAIISALTPVRKSRLWRTQLEHILRNEQLSWEQREFVLEAIDVVTPDNFALGAHPPDLCERIARLFPNRRQQQLFRATGLGSGVRRALALRPAWLSLVEQVRSATAVEAQLWNCNCRNDGWCECAFGYDCTNPEGCRECEGCCGCFFGSTCNQLCVERTAPRVPSGE